MLKKGNSNSNPISGARSRLPLSKNSSEAVYSTLELANRSSPCDADENEANDVNEHADANSADSPKSEKISATSENGSSIQDFAVKLLQPMQQIVIGTRGAILMTGLASTCYLLYWFKNVLVPFFLAIFLMYLVDPLVELLDVSPKYFCCVCTQRGRRARRSSRGCSRAFASLSAIVVVLVFLFLIGYVVVLSVNDFDIQAYQQGYSAFVGDLEQFLGKIGLEISIKTTLKDNMDKVAKMLLTDVVEVLSTLFITLIYLTYFLCTRVRPSQAGGVWAKVDRDIQRFVTLKAYLSLFVAILVTIVYVCLHVGLAVVWGVLTFLLNWIPNFGALIASCLPMIIIVITPSTVMSSWEKIFAILLPVVFHLLIGNFVEPKAFGRKLEMDPIVVIFSLSVWGLLWGMVGMMLSVPLTAAFKIMLSDLHIWPPIVAMMEGRFFESSLWGVQMRNNSDLSTIDIQSDIVSEDEEHGKYEKLRREA